MKFDQLYAKTFNESFFHGFENSFGHSKNWVEIFKNPSTSELKELGETNIGMILTKENVFVWNRNHAYHKHVMNELNNFNGIPILFDYNNKKECYCLITDASSVTLYHHNNKVESIIKKNPWISSKFNYIDIRYYDEDVVGNWSKL